MKNRSAGTSDLATSFLFTPPKALPQEEEWVGPRQQLSVFLTDTCFALWPDKERWQCEYHFLFLLSAGEGLRPGFYLLILLWMVHSFPVFSFRQHRELFILCLKYILEILSEARVFYTSFLYLMWCSQNYWITSIGVCKSENGFFYFIIVQTTHKKIL